MHNRLASRGRNPSKALSQLVTLEYSDFFFKPENSRYARDFSTEVSKSSTDSVTISAVNTVVLVAWSPKCNVQCMECSTKIQFSMYRRASGGWLDLELPSARHITAWWGLRGHGYGRWDEAPASPEAVDPEAANEANPEGGKTKESSSETESDDQCKRFSYRDHQTLGIKIGLSPHLLFRRTSTRHDIV